MRTQLSKFAKVAALTLALTFTLSCSSDDSGGSDGGGNAPGTSSPSGGDVSSSSITGSGGGSSSSATGGSGSSSSVATGGESSSSATGGGDGSCPTGISGTFVDNRNNKSYKLVKICDQTWMAENLNYAVEGGRCYNDEPANCVIYGMLYDWVTAMDIDVKYNTEVWDAGPPASVKHQDNSEVWNGSDVKHQGICPAGWHLPNDAEWVKLAENVGSSIDLKATNGWNDYNGNSGNGTDDYGFTAMPGGTYGLNYDRFENAGESGYWWSATNNPFGDSNVPTYVRMEYKNSVVDIRTTARYSGNLRSVRCVKD